MMNFLTGLAEVNRGCYEPIFIAAVLGLALIWQTAIPRREALWLVTICVCGWLWRMLWPISSSRYAVGILLPTVLLAAAVCEFVRCRSMTARWRRTVMAVAAAAAVILILVPILKAAKLHRGSRSWPALFSELRTLSADARNPLLITSSSQSLRLSYYTGIDVLRGNDFLGDAKKQGEQLAHIAQSQYHCRDVLLWVEKDKESDAAMRDGFRGVMPQVEWHNAGSVSGYRILRWDNGSGSLGIPAESSGKIQGPSLLPAGDFEKSEIYQVDHVAYFEPFRERMPDWLSGTEFRFAAGVLPHYWLGFQETAKGEEKLVQIISPGLSGNGALYLQDRVGAVFLKPFSGDAAYDGELRFHGKKNSRFEIYIIYNRDSRFRSIAVGGCVADGEIRQFRWHAPVLHAPDLLKDHHFYFAIRMINGNAVFDDVRIVESGRTANGG